MRRERASGEFLGLWLNSANFYTADNRIGASEVQVMRCTGCGGELMLTSVVPDETVAVRGVEHHTFICSACQITERRIVFVKDGREVDALPMPPQAVPRSGRALTEQDEHVSAQSLVGWMMAWLRGH
jgi:hypothetical protein